MKRRPFSVSASWRRMVSGVVAVAAVDDDVALLEQGHEAFDHFIGRAAGLDQHDDLAGALERSDEVLQLGLADETTRGVRVGGHEFFHLTRRPVVDGDFEAVVGDVKSQILAHDCEADEADFGGVVRHKCAVIVECGVV